MRDQRVRFALSWVLFTLILLFVGFSVVHAADTDGKAVFLAQKCNMCHSVQSAGIDRTLKSAKGSDLSDVGAKHDAAWLTKWLDKQEKIDGKVHDKAWKGTDAEKAAVTKWLASLKGK